MRLIICGSRDIEDVGIVRRCLRALPKMPDEIICGGARGVDASAEALAKELGIPCRVIPAEWKRYGRAAGPKRNDAMLEMADAVLAIHHDGSRGTEDMIAKARKAGKEVFDAVVHA